MQKYQITNINPSSPSIADRLRVAILYLLASPRRSLILILLITIITHLPSGFGKFVADDFVQWAMLKGSPELQEAGFTKADPNKSLPEKLRDGFHFFSAPAGTLQTYQEYGNLMWWSGQEISMVPFRPIAALTHWMDYTFFGDALWLHQLHSMIYFLLLSLVLFHLYRKLCTYPNALASLNSTTPAMAVIVLATLMALVDFSLTRSFLWVAARNSYLACVIGIVSLLCFIRWREQQGFLWLVASLFLFAAALLTAEAALGVAAYMGAYVLCLERRPLFKKFLTLVPVILVIVLWRIGYSENGFGALNIAQYIDPAPSPAQFAINFASVFPLIVFSQVTGLDSLVVFLHPDQHWKLIAAAWLLTGIGIALISPLLRSSAVDRFWLIGSVVAAIPGTALISAESRTMMFVSIGFFFLFAKWLIVLAQQPQALKRWTFRLLLAWHLLLPALLAVLITSGQMGNSQPTQQFESVKDRITSGETGLVVVNPDTSGMMYYLPFKWAFNRYAIPARMNILTTGLETSDLTRISERTFIIDAPAGMPLTHNATMQSLNGEQSAVNAFYSVLHAQSFFTTPAQRLSKGEVIHNADTRITVLATNNVGPTKIRLEFVGDESPDQKAWQWYDWQARRYMPMQPPAIHETRRFWGPLDQPAADVAATRTPTTTH